MFLFFFFLVLLLLLLPHASALLWNPPVFRKKNMVGYFFCILYLFWYCCHCCPMHCDLLRSVVLPREYADYFFLRGLFFQAWGSLTSLKSQTRGPQLKVPPGGLVLRIFTSWKNPSTSAGFEPANLGSRGEHVTPRPPRTTGRMLFYLSSIFVQFAFYEYIQILFVTVLNIMEYDILAVFLLSQCWMLSAVKVCQQQNLL